MAVQDFRFDSTCTSPYTSTPASPTRRGCPFDVYTSAPTSPTRVSAIYAHLHAAADNLTRPSAASAPSGVPFDWEETPGTPKSGGSLVKDDADAFDFDFGFRGRRGRPGSPALTAADELFVEGMIRPLKPPPRLQYPAADDRGSVASSPRSPRQKERGLWSPRHRGRSAGGVEFDPFAAAIAEATRETWKERTPAADAPPPLSSSSRRRKGSRSLSPLRDFFKKAPSNSPPPASAAASSVSPVSRRWRLRDLLLFRSAPEGGAARKYALLSSSKKVMAEDAKNSSFRSTGSGRSPSMRKDNERPSSFSQEMQYAASRATSEDPKMKTAPPYRQGLFSCLRFNPSVLSLSCGFNCRFFARR